MTVTFEEHLLFKLKADSFGRWKEIDQRILEGICRRVAQEADAYYPNPDEFEKMRDKLSEANEELALLQAHEDDLSKAEERISTAIPKLREAIEALRP